MHENDFYTLAFRSVRDQGFRYEGSGVYTKGLQRVRIRTFAEFQASPAGGYTKSADEATRAADAA